MPSRASLYRFSLYGIFFLVSQFGLVTACKGAQGVLVGCSHLSRLRLVDKKGQFGLVTASKGDYCVLVCCASLCSRLHEVLPSCSFSKRSLRPRIFFSSYLFSFTWSWWEKSVCSRYSFWWWSWRPRVFVVLFSCLHEVDKRKRKRRRTRMMSVKRNKEKERRK